MKACLKPATLLLVLLPGVVYSAPALQTLDSIQQAAREFAASHFAEENDNTAIETGKLDPRLRLKLCDQPLEAFLPPGASQTGNTSVGVRCGGAAPWSLLIPVKIRNMQEVVVLLQGLPHGTLLEHEHIRLETRDVNRLRNGFFTSADQVVGKALSRSVGNGQVLNGLLVKSPRLVHRGQQVDLIAGDKSISVRMSGIALADGTAGQRIRVKNVNSNRIVEGIVGDDGNVTVGR